MNRTKLLTLAIVGLFVLNAGLLVFMIQSDSQNKERPMNGPPGEGPKQIIIERLHFDEEQKKQYSLMVDEHRRQSKLLNKKSRTLHDSLYTLLKNPATAKSHIDSFIVLISQNQQAIDHLNYSHFGEIRLLCKKEQIAYFDKMVEDLTKLFAPHHPPK